MPRHIAIAAWNAAPIFDPAAGRAIGGVETFAWLLARSLAAREEVQVTFVLRHTRALPAELQGVAIAPLIEPLRGVQVDVSHALERRATFPWLRIKRFAPALLWQIPLLTVVRMWPGGVTPEFRLQQHIRSVPANLWLALGASCESAAVIDTATATGLTSVFWVQSNADLDPRFFAEPGYRNRYGVRASEARSILEQATAIVCQTAWQQARVRDLVGRESYLIRNPIDVERWAGEGRDVAGRDSVLWIGRYDRHHKRSELGLEIARRLPQIPFVFVINRGDATVEREVRRNLPANVRLIDFVPREDMPGVFSSARVFLFTGSAEYEGFPNVLLEAAVAGVPCVSLEEFDGFLSCSGGVTVQGDLDEAARRIERLWNDNADWELQAASAREYVVREHSVAATIQALERLLGDLGLPSKAPAP